ncbi:MAG: protocatechuate 3,4-dioxygenase subunit alpha [Gaiellaceae bacterium]
MRPTPSQTVGPFFSIGLCARPLNELVSPDDAHAVEIAGTVFDGAGVPVADSIVEIWQPESGWGRYGADGEASFRFVTVRPGATGGQAPHIEVLVFARGLLKAVRTRIYFPDEEEANAADPLLAALEPVERATLVAVPDGGRLRFDVHLQGDRQTAFFAL